MNIFMVIITVNMKGGVCETYPVMLPPHTALIVCVIVRATAFHLQERCKNFSIVDQRNYMEVFEYCNCSHQTETYRVL